MKPDSLAVIREVDKELRTNIAGTRELAFKDGEISKKNKLLIALAIDSAQHSEQGIQAFTIHALEAGASKSEIFETLRIVNYICGAGSMYPAAAALEGVL